MTMQPLTNSPGSRQQGIQPLQTSYDVARATVAWSFFCEVELTNKFEIEQPHFINLIANDASTKRGYICAGCMRLFPAMVSVYKTDLDTYLEPEKDGAKKEQE